MQGFASAIIRGTDLFFCGEGEHAKPAEPPHHFCLPGPDWSYRLQSPTQAGAPCFVTRDDRGERDEMFRASGDVSRDWMVLKRTALFPTHALARFSWWDGSRLPRPAGARQ